SSSDMLPGRRMSMKRVLASLAIFLVLFATILPSPASAGGGFHHGGFHHGGFHHGGHGCFGWWWSPGPVVCRLGLRPASASPPPVLGPRPAPRSLRTAGLRAVGLRAVGLRAVGVRAALADGVCAARLCAADLVSGSSSRLRPTAQRCSSGRAAGELSGTICLDSFTSHAACFSNSTSGAACGPGLSVHRDDLYLMVRWQFSKLLLLVWFAAEPPGCRSPPAVV